ncbi:MAG TPA: Lrp/AsnC ligand binding domain-containing protein [Candidatus Thermoplasmatota archaeon]|nr:Lrp/AsnC ligand binding domain-containing protein [Candidatus Thermoplasmatota archaeon]
MALGFVLISTEPGKDHDAYDALLKVPEIKEIVPLFGEFDLIAKIEADTFDELGRIVLEHVRSVPYVVNTRTLTGTKF